MQRRRKLSLVHADHTHDSMHEAEQCALLSQQQDAGLVRNLQRQVRFAFNVHGVRVGWYVASFTFDRWNPAEAAWDYVVEDAHTHSVRALHNWSRTKRLMLALFRVNVREV